VCPVCRSQVRQRMLAAMLDALAGAEYSENSLIRGEDVLQFAPEKRLQRRIMNSAAKCVTADYARGDCDLQLDMSNMPTVPSKSFDVVIACDVLEHVPDDRAAMRELRRVLREPGVAILTVPQKDSPSVTDEDAGVKESSERERRFGQKDHLRIFGDDFVERLANENFVITVLAEEKFPADAVQRHVLRPPVRNPHPLATNRRCIYIARTG